MGRAAKVTITLVVSIIILFNCHSNLSKLVHQLVYKTFAKIEKLINNEMNEVT